jgi:hypothetical protein
MALCYILIVLYKHWQIGLNRILVLKKNSHKRTKMQEMMLGDIQELEKLDNQYYLRK